MAVKEKRSKPLFALLILVIAMSVLVLFKVCQPVFIPYDVTGPSPVNTSIIKPLSGSSNYNFDELKAKIETIDAVSGAETYETPADNVVYSYYVESSTKYRASAGVSISLYRDHDTAKKSFDKEQGAGVGSFFYSKVGSKIEHISDEVEVICSPVFRTQDSDIPLIYESSRNLYTTVRIGNLLVEFSEVSESESTIGAPTNEALQQIVDALK